MTPTADPARRVPGRILAVRLVVLVAPKSVMFETSTTPPSWRRR